MEMCRGLEFEEKPDYDRMIGLFEGCRAQNNMHQDFIWKENKLLLEKECLKAELLALIKKSSTKPLIVQS